MEKIKNVRSEDRSVEGFYRLWKHIKKVQNRNSGCNLNSYPSYLIKDSNLILESKDDELSQTSLSNNKRDD